MLFNSIEYIVFFSIFFPLYWFIFNRSFKIQNVLLLIGSYIFYSWWDWRFLILIILSSILDFSIGILLSKEENLTRRKVFVGISLFFNLGLLAVFKYFNFFISSFQDLLEAIGLQSNPYSLNLILPVGISFYTFQTLSYTIDVYRKKIQPTTDVVAFFTFVSFFPQLVAGPIERAVNLLPEFNRKRVFDSAKAVDGLRQILWGLFKKVVVADNCATLVNIIFEDSQAYPPQILLLGSILFAFQIYGDFSGYSDIAIGTSKLLGIKLMQNFAFPYFSRDIAEFWRRWHISLSTWFRDYLYIPLGGSRVSKLKSIRNVFIIFLVSGFWHGANWTFIVWGGINALYFMPSFIFETNRKYTNQISEASALPSLREFSLIIKTFLLTCFAWIFFRAESISAAFDYITNMFSIQNMNLDMLKPENILNKDSAYLFLFIIILIIIEWINRNNTHGLQFISKYLAVRWIIYLGISLAIVQYFGSNVSFIYFQF